MRSQLRSCALLFVCAALYCSCKTTAPAPIVVPPPVPAVPLDTRVSWILRLEQQRILRDAGIDAPAAAAGARSIAPARTPDLTALLTDTDGAVRRRAALAIGRIGNADGVAPLAAALSADSDADVRAMAAFALGLIGARAGVEPLTMALSDASIVVRSRAIEGLGLVGDSSAADAIANAAPNCRQPLSAVRPDDEEGPKTPEVELCRLALYSLVRLKQFDQLAKVALDAQGQPVSTWWPVAYALQRIADKRAVPALLALANTDGVYTPAFALRGLGELGEKQAAPLARSIAMPMRKRQKKVQEFQSSLKVGDRVITTGGIYGHIAKVNDQSVKLQIADKLQIEVSRAAIGGYQGQEPVVQQDSGGV